MNGPRTKIRHHSHLFCLQQSVRGLVELLRRHVHRLLHLPRRRAHELGVAVLAQALVPKNLLIKIFVKDSYCANVSLKSFDGWQQLPLPTRFSAEPATGSGPCFLSLGLLGTDLDMPCGAAFEESPFAEISR